MERPHYPDRVNSSRIVKGEKSLEKRYYISNLPLTPQQGAEYVRSHWSVENHLHWSMDVVFREDASQISVGHAPENLALFRRMAQPIIQADIKGKVGVAKKRRQAGWDDAYLLHLLGTLVNEKR